MKVLGIILDAKVCNHSFGTVPNLLSDKNSIEGHLAAQSLERVTLGLAVVSLSPRLDVEIT